MILMEIHLEDVLQSENMIVELKINVRLLDDLSPMTFTQGFVFQIHHHRQR